MWSEEIIAMCEYWIPPWGQFPHNTSIVQESKIAEETIPRDGWTKELMLPIVEL